MWVAIAAAAFHVAYASPHISFVIVLYLLGLLQLARAETWRMAFYPGLAVGLVIAAGRLAFFWKIFSGGAVALWLVYAFWIGLFVAMARLCLRRLGPHWGWLLIPCVWLGLEYFRSELYYLRFSWLNVGYAFAQGPPHVALRYAGVYGMGFVLMSVAAAAGFSWRKSVVRSMVLLLIGTGGVWAASRFSAGERAPLAAKRPHVAGIQMEFPTDNEVLFRLKDLVRKHPEVEVVVLSEVTFDGPVPQAVQDWCRKNRRYLVAGGKDRLPGGNFYNTVFVIGPDGQEVFRQVKSVPIQFYKDGLPAPEQKVWDSPWGKIGICICYDLSYTRVTDLLVRQGAQALIVPTMDMMDWGEAQHRLHARVAPVRAAEYGIPIFRLASSGISQWADRNGRVVADTPCPRDGAVLMAELPLAEAGRLPLDRWLASLAVGVTGALLVVFVAYSKEPSDGAVGGGIGRSRVRHADVSPLQGLGIAGNDTPRALPWAVLLPPFRRAVAGFLRVLVCAEIAPRYDCRRERGQYRMADCSS
jgi:apolipoprotein N-acyltransferase